ncbi:unnamed protein product, partial [Sphacelaria rigidula]
PGHRRHHATRQGPEAGRIPGGHCGHVEDEPSQREAHRSQREQDRGYSSSSEGRQGCQVNLRWTAKSQGKKLREYRRKRLPWVISASC